jgi:radical SAM superfamily enzyme YgiQ (UPF0313 family)
MKVCLVRGALVSPRGSVNNEPTPPIGLAYVAASLKAAGWPVQGIDATAQALNRVDEIPGTRLQANGIGIDEVVEQIDPATEVIGVSVMFSHEWVYQRALLGAIRRRFPRALLLAGGEHCTALPEYVLGDCPSLDCIALGEGEETMVELCGAVAAGRDGSNVPGLVARGRDGLVRTPPRPRIRQLDDVPWPDWDVFPIEPYLAGNISFGASFGRNMPILASRGCPYQCTFCSNPAMWTTRYLVRSPENVIAEIEHYRRRFNITGLQFYDLTAIVKKQWIIDFCQQLVARGITLDWSLPSGTRSEALDDEALSWIARANGKYLVYAPESGSAATLKRVKKKIRLDHMEDSMRAAVRRGIVVRTNIIIGFPDESRREIFATLRALMRFAWIGVDEIALGLFQPYPGTELFEGLRRRGRVAVNDEYFETLAHFSTGKLSPATASVCDAVGRHELYCYRVLGTLLFLALAYGRRPARIWRTIHNIAFTDRSSTVIEQRLRDRLRRMRAALASRSIFPAMRD